jgi:hypothetical protein
MFKLISLASLIVCLTIGEAHSQHMLELGSCGMWLEYRTTYSNSVRTAQMEGWAIGYLSGTAVWSDNLDPLQGVDADAVFYWLDNYCREHPIDPFSKALAAFVHAHPR